MVSKCIKCPPSDKGNNPEQPRHTCMFPAEPVPESMLCHCLDRVCWQSWGCLPLFWHLRWSEHMHDEVTPAGPRLPNHLLLFVLLMSMPFKQLIAFPHWLKQNHHLLASLRLPQSLALSFHHTHRPVRVRTFPGWTRQVWSAASGPSSFVSAQQRISQHRHHCCSSLAVPLVK